MRSRGSWTPVIVLGVLLFLVIGVPMTDDALGEITSHKIRCTVTSIEADVDDAGKLSSSKPVRARCTIPERHLSWDATARQLGIADWTTAIGDTIDADVKRWASFLGREIYGAYVFTNVKRT